MAKKSVLSEAQETIVEAAKTGVAVAKLAATAGLAAAGPAAAGAVLESISKGLHRAEQRVEDVTPGEVVERVGIMPSPARKKSRRKNPSGRQKKRTETKGRRAGKRSVSKKKRTIKKRAAKKTAKRKRGKSHARR